MRKDQLLKLVLSIVGAALFFSIKVHAAQYDIKIKPPKQPQTYQVCDKHADNCKEMNAAEATIAKLQDQSRRVFKVVKTEVEIAQGTRGLEFDKK